MSHPCFSSSKSYPAQEDPKKEETPAEKMFNEIRYFDALAQNAAILNLLHLAIDSRQKHYDEIQKSLDKLRLDQDDLVKSSSVLAKEVGQILNY